MFRVSDPVTWPPRDLQFVLLHRFGGDHNLIDRRRNAQRLLQRRAPQSLTSNKPLVTSPTPTG